jgi:hypothetical protein
MPLFKDNHRTKYWKYVVIVKHTTLQALVLVTVFCVFFSPLHKSNIEFTRTCNKGVEYEHTF